MTNIGGTSKATDGISNNPNRFSVYNAATFEVRDILGSKYAAKKRARVLTLASETGETFASKRVK